MIFELILVLILVFFFDGILFVDVIWIIYGVLYVKVDNLESMVYGVGYVFVCDNFCVLVDQIVKYNFERVKYFGLDIVFGSGDLEYFINDFGFFILGIRELVEESLFWLFVNLCVMF